MFERLNSSASYAILFIALVVLLMLPSMTQMGSLLQTQGFEPHGHCFQWRPDILRMYTVSDSLIGLSYVAISILLFYFYNKLRDDVPFPWVFLAFGAFIITCGITHFMSVWTLWNPTYKLSAYAKFATAIASTGTAIILPPLLPRIQRIIAEAKKSEQRKTEIIASNTALKQSEERLRTVIDNAPVILTVVDRTGTVTMMEGQALSWLGLDVHDILNRSVFDIIEDEDEPILQTLRDALAGQEGVTILDVNAHILEVRMSPMTDASKAITGVILVSNDITERRRAELELRRAYEQERELHTMKSNFIESISHEFRTPLTIISSSGQMLQRYADRMTPERREEHTTKIQDEINKMVRMLDDVLMIEQIETDRLTFQPRMVEVETMTTNIITDLQAGIPDHSITYQGDATCPTAHMDSNLVTLILENLVQNAVKYSVNKREVRVSLRCEGDQAVFKVSDNGIGIPAQDQPRIFERFYRGGNISNISGTGLGLAIVKRAVELHRGTIIFTSTEGKGTTFTVTLPLRVDAPADD